jgi:spermidine synthase
MDDESTPSGQINKKDLPYRRSVPVAFVPSCFFLSGVAGLIYQVVWIRLIDKVIGSAPFAVATVLSVFMGGLALGSYLAGRYIDRIASKGKLLALYGKVEIAIGVYGLILPFFVMGVDPVYRMTYNALFEHFWFYQFFTFAGCTLLLIFPTALMGVTLPVLCRFYVSQRDHLGTRTGRLYGLNTMGAAVGALLCGFLLIRSLGVWGTLFLAAGLNFFVGFLCVLLARPNVQTFSKETANSRAQEVQRNEKEPEIAGGTQDDKKTMGWALFIFAVSGFCSMGYEVFWARLLGLIIGPTTYSFTIVISTFIIGLAGGSILFGWLGDRSKRVFSLLAITQLSAACLALLVSQFLGNSQFFFSKMIYTFRDDFRAMILGQSMVLFVCLLGPTVFLGATFPLVNRIYARSIPVIGKSIGTAYALNTVGAILGSFVAGFVLIPFLGKENGLRLVIGLQFFVALAALMPFALKSAYQKRQWILGSVAIVAAVVLISHFPSWNRKILSRGWYRDFDAIEYLLAKTSWLEAIWRGSELLTYQKEGLEVVFYGDGIGGFTTVEKERTSVGTVEYAMLNSGKTDASTHGDRSTQTLLAHVPMLFHPHAQNVMVLGLASGMTSGEVLLYPVKQLDVLEINEQVVEACQLFFTPWNNDCLNDPRTRIIVQDGRNHLALTHEKYDVIISEPSNPWMAGLANLYTLEFFQLVKDRLNDAGMFAQWIHSYEIDWDTFAMVGRTFFKAFPHSLMMKIGLEDYLLVGFSGDHRLDWKTADKNIQYARHSSNVSFHDAGFLVHFIVTEDIGQLFGNGPIHTDKRPLLEFAAPEKLYGRDGELVERTQDRLWLSSQTLAVTKKNSTADVFLDLTEFAASAFSPLFGMIHFEGLTPVQKERYADIVERFCGQVVVRAYDIFPEMEMVEKCAQVQIQKMQEYLAEVAPRAIDHYNLSRSWMAIGRREKAVQELRAAISLDPKDAGARESLGLLLANMGNFQEAQTHLSEAIAINPQAIGPYKILGMVYLQLGKTDAAVQTFSRAEKLRPDDVEVMNKLGAVLLRQGKSEKAIEKLSVAVLIDPENAEAHNNLGAAFYGQNQYEEAMKHFSEALRIAPNNQDVRDNLAMVRKKMKINGG